MPRPYCRVTARSGRRGRIFHDVRIAIAGSSGLIGTALVRRLVADGHQVVRLVRGKGSASVDGTTTSVTWDPVAGRLPFESIDGTDAVVNLAGAGIGDQRWTDS